MSGSPVYNVYQGRTILADGTRVDPLTLEDSVLHGGQTVPPLKLN